MNIYYYVNNFFELILININLYKFKQTCIRRILCRVGRISFLRAGFPAARTSAARQKGLG
ncbi:hypothetical protein NITGR_250106 [Nitrospina gracilis 3/211]|uniref:Uncharacterized protein n=1 Tax=Nitrospina gracilis (strain 3/211) TaxID=1266370 RepID=M1ZAD1_NITG3|nr:hypothetical protein NITGR_250106 [Nitrospina gracilis 3/211]